MSWDITFQSLLTTLKEELKLKGQYEEVLSNFHSEKSVSKMFEYFWGLEEAHTNLVFSLVPSSKAEAKADGLRADGNKFYQNNILDKALYFYNLSIMQAPHPDLKNSWIENNNNELKSEGDKNQKSKSLALGFANRSAVLFELDQFEKCIADIDLALQYGYPQDQQSKLTERKSKCLIALNKQKDAEVLLETAISALVDVNLDNKNTQATKTRLSKILKECEKGTKKSPQQSSSAKAFEHLFSYTNPSAPELSKENPNMPGASNKVKMKYSQQKGRYLVTDRTVMPGELLLVEKSYASCPYVKQEVLKNLCCNCLARCHNPLPCPNCDMAIFCSDNCRTIGLKGFHYIECSSISTLAALNLGQNFCTLLYRIIAQTPYAEMRDTLTDCEKEQQQVNSEIKCFNNKGIFDTYKFETVLSLVGNIEQRSPEDLLKRAALAFVLIQLLILSKKYFVDLAGEPFSPDDKETILLGSTLMSLVMKMPCNSMAICQFQVNVDNPAECSNEEAGAGMFPMSCLMNHSCNPSATHHSYGNHMVTYATKYIPEGSEITINYGYHYSNEVVQVRKAELKSTYFFDCQCEACEDRWPTLSNLSLKPGLKNSSSMKQSELKKLWMQFKMAKDCFVKSYENISQGKVGKSEIKACSDLLVFLEKHVTIPCRMYHETQEALKYCLNRGTPCTFISK